MGPCVAAERPWTVDERAQGSEKRATGLHRATSTRELSPRKSTARRAATLGLVGYLLLALAMLVHVVRKSRRPTGRRWQRSTGFVVVSCLATTCVGARRLTALYPTLMAPRGGNLLNNVDLLAFVLALAGDCRQRTSGQLRRPCDIGSRPISLHREPRDASDHSLPLIGLDQAPSLRLCGYMAGQAAARANLPYHRLSALGRDAPRQCAQDGQTHASRSAIRGLCAAAQVFVNEASRRQ